MCNFEIGSLGTAKTQTVPPNGHGRSPTATITDIINSYLNIINNQEVWGEVQVQEINSVNDKGAIGGEKS